MQMSSRQIAFFSPAPLLSLQEIYPEVLQKKRKEKAQVLLTGTTVIYKAADVFVTMTALTTSPSSSLLFFFGGTRGH